MLEFLRSKKKGITAICSAHQYVLQAACKWAKESGEILLIESTSNQVDQFGGYTGLTPAKFVAYVEEIAKKQNLSREQLILGGDHLGPNVWQTEPADQAMKKAQDQICDYVKAGYLKLHLDTSMRCADDPGDAMSALNVSVATQRAARLCRIAEDASTPSRRPLYIIGTDVPVPGGAKEELSQIRITPVAEVEETISFTKKSFYKLGLEDAWERVIAVVVQPGVEFGDDTIIEYDRARAKDLSRLIENHENLIYEVHSTDYQKKKSLCQLVQDHFVILKVGPWLTYAFREAIFSLAAIEKELFQGKKHFQLSNIIDVIERQMIKNPKYWQAHHQGDPAVLRIARRYSYSDRIRYYWPIPVISDSLARLIRNLSRQQIPLTVLSQFMPRHYRAVREGQLENIVLDLIHYSIREVLHIYAYATAKVL